MTVDPRDATIATLTAALSTARDQENKWREDASKLFGQLTNANLDLVRLTAALVEARGALEESKGTLRHARTFIRSREVMALTGRELYAETKTKVDTALATIKAALGRVE